MPPVNPPSELWLAQQLEQLKADVAALKATGTQYVVDQAGVCQAIIGNIVADPAGVSTGLSGWGVAVLEAGGWVSLQAKLRSHGSTTVTFTASTSSNVVGVTHGLGVKPATVLVSVQGAGTVIVASNTTPTSSGFNVQAFTPSAITGPVTVCWEAII